MSLELARIDDRLVHGQVVLGCCGALGARRIVLADDDVQRDQLQSRVYAAAIPPHIELEILDLSGAARRLCELDEAGDAAPTLLVVASPSAMLVLVEMGAPISRVNVGGLHHREGAREIWPGFYLTESDVQDLKALMGRGLSVELQSLPGGAHADAASLLGRDAPGEPR